MKPDNFYVFETDLEGQATQAAQRKSANNFRVFGMMLWKMETGQPKPFNNIRGKHPYPTNNEQNNFSLID